MHAYTPRWDTPLMELGGGSSEKRNDETRTEASSLHVTKQEYCRLAQFHACMHVRDRAAGAGCWAYSAATRVGDDEESVGGSILQGVLALPLRIDPDLD